MTVKNIAAPGYYADGGGLWLQVTKAGSRSWVFRYQRDKRRHEMGLGALTAVTLSGARAAAAELRKVLASGGDPLAQRREQQAAERLERARAMTFADAAEQYIEAHRSSWRNPKHAEQWTSTIRDHANPVFGSLPVADIDTALVRKCLAAIWTSRHETALRLRGRIETILDWATVAGLRQGENPARWKGHLEHLLPKISRAARIVHHPALPYQEAGVFMEQLRARPGVAARAVEFTVLTAARSGEVRGATWGEFDLAAGVWVVPASRMKGAREHRVPLSSRALELLRAQKKASPEGFVFPGARNGRPLSDMGLTAVLRRMGRGDITVHGFRSAFRDWGAEQTAYPAEMLEMALAHAISNKVEAAYRRGDLFEKRRRLMQDWSDFCDRKQVADGANVIQIGKQAAA